MKKVLFVLAFVAVYGVSMAMTSSNIVVADNAQVTIVAAMDDNNVVAPEGEKEKKATKETAKAKGDAKAKGCAGAKSEAKGCAGEKTAKCKKACGSSCGGEKK